jgi:hypothetical protein
MSPVPPPQPSPQVHRDDGDPNDPRTITGVYRALDSKFKGEKVFNLVVAVIALVVSLGTLIGGYNHIISEARAQSDAGLAAVVPPLDKRVVILEQQQQQTREDVHEVQTDIRALYKAVMTGARQDRLEQPAPPPKPLDGGP